MSRYTESPIVTLEEVRDRLLYAKATGIFVWIKPQNGKNKIGDRAGSLAADGYRNITIGQRSYPEHRLAWFYVYGVWPKSKLDHKNRQRDDNRMNNLREATISQNGANKFIGGGKLGVKGVTRKNKHSFRASIKFQGKNIYLGTYRDITLASKAYREAAIKLFGEFVCFGEET